MHTKYAVRGRIMCINDRKEVTGGLLYLLLTTSIKPGVWLRYVVSKYSFLMLYATLGNVVHQLKCYASIKNRKKIKMSYILE